MSGDKLYSDDDVWAKIDADVEELRTRKTPLYVHKRIMDSLPDDLYGNKVPWYRKPVVLSPLSLISTIIGAIVLGMLFCRYF